jgi:hypothetical protein
MHFLFSLIFLAIGGGLLFVGLRSARVAKAAQTWPKVAGLVTASRVDEKRDSMRNSNGMSDLSFTPVVSYAYEVAGVKYTGDHISVGPMVTAYGSSGSAGKALAAWPLGKTIDVLVDPANPANAVLSAKAGMNLILPIVFLAIGAVVLFINF